MRKAIKKIATVVASVSMIAAMSISAFAADTYQFAGNPNLVGNSNPDDNTVGWKTVLEEQFLTPVDGLDGVYEFKGNYVLADNYDSLDDETKAGYREFKILADGDYMGWSFQMCLGIPEAAWADNQSQFRIGETIEPGEFTAYVDPSKGFVAIIQNQQNVNLLVRYHSRDEDSWNYVKTIKADIVADGYAEGDVYFDDAAYLEFINKCLEYEGGTAIESIYPGETAPSSDDTIEPDTTAGGEETTANSETTTTKKNEDKDDDSGVSPVVIVVIVVVVVAVIGVIVAFTKKKN